MYDQKLSTKTRVLLLRNTKASSNIINNFEYKEIIKINDDFDFITFFDLRTAVEAYKELHKNFIDVNFCLHTQELENACQGTVFLSMKDMQAPLTDEEIHDELEKFGEIKEVRDYKNFKKYVEFFDSRAALEALKINVNAFNKGKVECKLAWDNNPKKREELEQIVAKVINEKEETGNVFVEALDEFIFSKLKQIEKMIRERYN
ncbi:hypothetical protein SLOPH_234 [Spraguea lophii 42_110]|uniref:RRM domain-containing protein n=1 Tax=Spraguea lophii (strain 42_110) TaxID=1358809 RepID=S7W7Z7_SPRLO|nr:hypothetical protein SLOPH_234 [Spraguea lophii 42_110]